MKNLRLLVFLFTLISYTAFAMQGQTLPQTAEQQEAQRFADYRDDALRIVIQEGYLDPEILGPRFLHTLSSLNTRVHGTSYTELPEACIDHFTFSPDGRLCAMSEATDRKKGIIHIYDVTQLRNPLRILQNPSDHYNGILAFSPDSKFLFAAEGEILHKWDIAQGVIVEDFKCPDDLLSIDDLNHDCTLMIGKDTAERHIVYNLATGAETRSTWSSNYLIARFSPDGKSIVIGTCLGDDPRIHLCDTTLQNRIPSPISDVDVSLISSHERAISPSGKLLAGKSNWDSNFVNIWKTIKILSTVNGQAEQSIKPKRQALHFAFSHDDHIIVINNAKSIDFYEIKTGKCIQSIPFEIHANRPHQAFLFSDTGRLEFSSKNQLAVMEMPYVTVQSRAEVHKGRIVIFDLIPQNIRAALRCLSVNQLLILISLVKPLAAGNVIHLTPDSNAWKLVHTMPEPLRDLLAPCLQPAGIVSRLTQAAQQHPALLSSVAAAASMAAYLIFKRK